MIEATVEEAYAEATRVIGEQVVTIRLLGAEAQRLAAENEALRQQLSQQTEPQ